MLVLDLDPFAAVHLAAALRRHRAELSRAGRPFPPELVRLEDLALETARSGQKRSGAAGAVNKLSRLVDAELGGHDRHLLTAQEVAGVLSVSPRTVRRLLAVGELRSIKVGGARRVERTELERYLVTSAEEGQ